MIYHSAFFDKYGLNLSSSAFAVLTANRRSRKTTDQEIIMIGDSHGWGQGAPGYDSQSYFSAHMSHPTNHGFFAEVKAFIERKWDMYQIDAIPLLTVGCGSYIVSGTIHQTQVPIASSLCEEGFYTCSDPLDSAIPRLGYLAAERKFGDEVSVITWETQAEGARKAEVCIEMTAHARKLYIGLLMGSNGARMEIALHTSATIG